MSFRHMVDLRIPDLAHGPSPLLLVDHRSTPLLNTPFRAILARRRRTGLIAGSCQARCIDDTTPDKEVSVFGHRAQERKSGDP